ncbi:hypothetical protein K469DRAFT_688400 [Zopfia rhizophila CBS 207.26]|uniref:Uncharacterized protein n=1 Tax=Zopfia rhizophila CBS 207.26 TaxID=1314779 RepID=A0A6A6E0L5_9PEZI|nr:hypothetical protein K469DRAFT_688400 [Zopfia rhizophila CBS 207.26]
MSNESAKAVPSTPKRSSRPAPPDTWRRARFFNDYDEHHNDEPVQDIATRHGIGRRTAFNWLAERRIYSSPVAVHRMRRVKAEDKGHKLGRLFKIPQDTLDKMCKAATNPVRWKPLSMQRLYWEIPTTVRTLQWNLKKRKKGAGIEEEERENPENQAEEHEQVQDWAVHMYSWVNYYKKGPFNFYSEDDPKNNLLPTPKLPGKPRKKKNETWEQYGERVTNWEASRPPEVELQTTGAHMA